MSIVEQLRRGRRELEMPAEIRLAGGESLRCTRILRLLPGKRAVMAAQWKGRSVLAKLMPDTASGRRNMRRELAGYRLLKDAEIMTPDLLLAGRCDGRGHILLFEFLQEAQRLGELWRNHAGRRLDIAAASVRLIASLHRQGCRHTDPHFDNFLLAGGQPVVVDVASVERRPRTEYGAWQRQNLAYFLAQFAPLQRKMFLDSLAVNYAQAAADDKLDHAIGKAWRRRKSRYLKKCFRECSDFSTHTSWRRVSVWKRAEQCDDLASFLQDPDAWVNKGERLKDGNSATVVRLSLGGRFVVIKRNNIKHIGHCLQRCLRATRSRINWRNAHLLQFNGIATPEPIAFMETRWGPFRLRGYYVCAFNEFPSAAKKYSLQQPTAQELAWFEELFTAMRMARIYHGDLKASNLFVTDKGISLVDLDSMKECSAKTNMRGLLQKDRRRFLDNWKDKPEQLKVFAGIFSES